MARTNEEASAHKEADSRVAAQGRQDGSGAASAHPSTVPVAGTPVAQPLPPTERADEVTDWKSHERELKALEADTVTIAERDAAILAAVEDARAEHEAALLQVRTAWKKASDSETAAHRVVEDGLEAQLTALQAELETERARAEEAERREKEAWEFSSLRKTELAAANARAGRLEELARELGGEHEKLMNIAKLAWAIRTDTDQETPGKLDDALECFDDLYRSHLARIVKPYPYGEPPLSTAPQASTEQASPSPAVLHSNSDPSSGGSPRKDEQSNAISEMVAPAGGDTGGAEAPPTPGDESDLASPSPAVGAPKPEDMVRITVGRHRGRVARVTRRACPSGVYVWLDDSEWGYQTSELEPAQPAPSPAMRSETTNENVLADDFARAFSCCGGNDETPQGHCADCPDHPSCPGCGNEKCECESPSPAVGDEGCDRCGEGPFDPCDRGVSHSQPAPGGTERCDHDWGPVCCWRCGQDSPALTPAEPQGSPEQAECPHCDSPKHTFGCPNNPSMFKQPAPQPAQAGDRVDQLRADVARAFRALDQGVSNHQVANRLEGK